MNNLDIPIVSQIGFQDPATPIMEGIIDLHHNIMFFLIVIFVLVLWLFAITINEFSLKWSFPKTILDVQNRNEYLNNNKITHHTILEIVWTLIPSIILMLIAFPSFILLYSLDEIINPAITVKAIGYQWYWSYEYSDYKDNIAYMSSMKTKLNYGDFRLLEVDQPLVFPIHTHIRVLVTAADVLHSWGIPSLGIKMDAVPGRLNQVSIFLKREGTFYGQCSELCGQFHGFMPIVIKGVKLQEYINWLKQ